MRPISNAHQPWRTTPFIYTYAANSPTRLVDPDGRTIIWNGKDERLRAAVFKLRLTKTGRELWDRLSARDELVILKNDMSIVVYDPKKDTLKLGSTRATGPAEVTSRVALDADPASYSAVFRTKITDQGIVAHELAHAELILLGFGDKSKYEEFHELVSNSVQDSVNRGK